MLSRKRGKRGKRGGSCKRVSLFSSYCRTFVKSNCKYFLSRERENVVTAVLKKWLTCFPRAAEHQSPPISSKWSRNVKTWLLLFLRISPFPRTVEHQSTLTSSKLSRKNGNGVAVPTGLLPVFLVLPNISQLQFQVSCPGKMKTCRQF